MKPFVLTSLLLASLSASSQEGDERTYLVEMSTFKTMTKEQTSKLSFDLLGGEKFTTKSRSLISSHFEPKDALFISSKSSDSSVMVKGAPLRIFTNLIFMVKDSGDSASIHINYNKTTVGGWDREFVDGGVWFIPKLVQAELKKDIAFASLSSDRKCKEIKMSGSAGETLRVCVTSIIG